MAYVGNPKKADKWGLAISAGTKVFKQIEEQTKSGFARPLILRIMAPVWPFFEQQLPEDVEQIHLDLEEMFDDFWKDYVEVTAEMKVMYPNDDMEPPSTMFYSRLAMALEQLYDNLKDVQ